MPVQDYALFAAIQKELAADNVTQRPLGDYTIFKYSIPCVLERRWNKWNRLARGLVFHVPTQTVVARPMPKFFNLDENEESRLENLPQAPGLIFEKLDGSCILVFMRDGKVACATPGAMDSPQAAWAERELASRGLTTDPDFIHFVTNTTPVFEAIYPENLNISNLVVNYGARKELVLLACLDHDGHDWAPNRVNMLAGQFGFPRPRIFDHQLSRTMPEAMNEEGFVITWFTQNETRRVKYKFEPYKYLQKIIGGVSPTAILELLMSGAYGTLAESLPQHVRERADDIASKLRQRFYDLKVQVETAFDRVKDLPTRKEQAQALLNGTTPKHIVGLVFSKLDGHLRDLSYWEVIRKWDKTLSEAT